MKTTKFGLPFIHSAQAQKEITHNEAIAIIDSLLQPVVCEQEISSLPSDAINGDMFMISKELTGELKGLENKIACKIEGGWHFIEPGKWMTVTTKESGQIFRFTGSNWKKMHLIEASFDDSKEDDSLCENLLTHSDNGSFFKVIQLSDTIYLEGESIRSNIEIPERSIVFGVSTKVEEDIQGPLHFSVGVEEDQYRYANKLDISKDSKNIGMTSTPLTYWDNTRIIFTPFEGIFKSGQINLVIHLVKMQGNWS